MRNIFLSILILLISIHINAEKDKPGEFGRNGEKKKFPLYLYDNYASKHDMYFIPSGYMGDIFTISLVGYCKKNPYNGNSCIMITYNPSNSSQIKFGWGGIYWLNPPDNWGIVKNAGYNLIDAKKFIFYARGKKGNEYVEFKVGGIKGKYPDSAKSKLLKIKLTKKWKKYIIPLDKLNMSYIIGGFAIILPKKSNKNGAVFYLDEMFFSD